MNRAVTTAALLAACTFGMTDAARAQEATQGWSGKGELGYVVSHGNSESESANAKLEAILGYARWKHGFFLGALYGRNTNVTSAQRLDTRFQSDYQTTRRLFAFGALRYQNDRFSGFDYQASVSVGLGYRFIDSDTTRLAGRVGVGYQRLRPETLVKDANGVVIDRVRGATTSSALGTVGIDYEHELNEHVRIINKFLADSGLSNTSLQNEFSLQVKMTEKLALSAGYTVRDNTNPPPGLKKLDTVSTLNIVYGF
jgi:putative salt-induced outer membrane protein